MDGSPRRPGRGRSRARGFGIGRGIARRFARESAAVVRRRDRLGRQARGRPARSTRSAGPGLRSSRPTSRERGAVCRPRSTRRSTRFRPRRRAREQRLGRRHRQSARAQDRRGDAVRSAGCGCPRALLVDAGGLPAHEAARAAAAIIERSCSLNGVNAHMYTAEYNSGEGGAARARRARRRASGRGTTSSCNVICPAAATEPTKPFSRCDPGQCGRAARAEPDAAHGRSRGATSAASRCSSRANDARYVTGNTLFVDGGSHLNGVAVGAGAAGGEVSQIAVDELGRSRYLSREPPITHHPAFRVGSSWRSSRSSARRRRSAPASLIRRSAPTEGRDPDRRADHVCRRERAGHFRRTARSSPRGTPAAGRSRSLHGRRRARCDVR